VNTLAADSAGEALYADLSVVPHVTDEHARRCVTSPLGQELFATMGLPVLDGSTTACDWGTDADAVTPGIFGPSRQPVLLRRDFVTNSNDSHWLSNPAQPLTGFPRIIGDERTERNLRTRLGIRMVQQRLDGSDGLSGRGFTLGQLQTVMFNNRNYGGELVRDDLVAVCEANPTVRLADGTDIDLRPACRALALWNLRDASTASGSTCSASSCSSGPPAGWPCRSTPRIPSTRRTRSIRVIPRSCRRSARRSGGSRTRASRSTRPWDRSSPSLAETNVSPFTAATKRRASST
jgi:acyl-homoserine lactone acylase PvdQ